MAEEVAEQPCLLLAVRQRGASVQAPLDRGAEQGRAVDLSEDLVDRGRRGDAIDPSGVDAQARDRLVNVCVLELAMGQPGPHLRLGEFARLVAKVSGGLTVIAKVRRRDPAMNGGNWRRQ